MANPGAENNAEESGGMGFLEHLEELRWRLIKGLIAVFVCAVPCGYFWRAIFNFVIMYPLSTSDPKPHLIFSAPTAAVVLSVQIALIGGLIIASPIVFYQLWKFVAPGLYPGEKKLILPLVIFTTFSFLAGMGFSYLILPIFLKFLMGFGAGALEPYFRADEYMSFLFKIVFAFGLIFEMPVVSFVLAHAGIISHKVLLKYVRLAILIIFIVAAILTPTPDAFSMILMAMPLLALYGISIIVAYYAGKKNV
ncbi:MAG: twin-arginine translocase subunit TatC [Chitinivibrionales bacterium]|nr:twin-arginine translocase subunit TatC [Chitinivibrionales bacterium]